jgi:hypothetical protein
MRRFILIGAVLCALPFYAGADTVRPAVGKPLLQAETLMRKGDYHAALLKVNQASAVAGLTAYEGLVIAQVRGAAAAGAGDYIDAANSYQTVLAAGAQPQAAQTQLIQAIAGFYYQAADYPHAITWVNRYIEAQGDDPRTRALLAQSYYQEGDYKNAEQAAWREQQAAQIIGQKLPEGELQLLASSAEKSGDQAGYLAALEALLTDYPSPQYWTAAIDTVAALPDFPDNLTIDVYRLRFATGTLTAAGDYEDYAERAILAGHTAEAKQVIGQGFASGILTADTDAGHAARLRTLVAQDASTPSAPPADALDVGITDFHAGEQKIAIAAFKSVPGYSDITSNNPAAALARLWVIRVENDTAEK